MGKWLSETNAICKHVVIKYSDFSNLCRIIWKVNDEYVKSRVDSCCVSIENASVNCCTVIALSRVVSQANRVNNRTCVRVPGWPRNPGVLVTHPRGKIWGPAVLGPGGGFPSYSLTISPCFWAVFILMLFFNLQFWFVPCVHKLFPSDQK